MSCYGGPVIREGEETADQLTSEARKPTQTKESPQFTVADLEGLPDDGMRYELVDGQLLVTPAPLPIHQRVVVQLTVRLEASCPEEFEVFVAPFDFRPASGRSLQPDVLVCRCGEAGVGSYWLIDPDQEALTVLELEHGRYVERAVVKGDEAFEARLPFDVRVVPGELVRRVSRSGG